MLAVGLLTAGGLMAPGVPDIESTLLAEREGFGASATGGAGGRVVTVTSTGDSGPGTLRELAGTPGPKWIRFDPDVFPLPGGARISLRSMLAVTADTTIDGRGARAVISGAGLSVDVPNVIVANLIFDFRHDYAGGDVDAVSLGWPRFGATSDIWLHHNTFLGAGPGRLDGAIDMARQAHDITVSWNRFVWWDKTILTGNDYTAAEAADRVSFHHNYFDRNGQRQPLARFNRFHSYNNWFRDWQYSSTYGEATVVSAGAQLLSEANVYDHSLVGDGSTFLALYPSTEGGAVTIGDIRDVGSYFSPGVIARTHRPEAVLPQGVGYRYRLDPVSTPATRQALRDALNRGAGWQAA